MTTLIILIGAAVGLLFAFALCRAAARGYREEQQWMEKQRR